MDAQALEDQQRREAAKLRTQQANEELVKAVPTKSKSQIMVRFKNIRSGVVKPKDKARKPSKFWTTEEH